MTTRSHKEVDGKLDGERQRQFMSAILADLRALDRMISENMFDTGVRRIGAEQEMFLIDKQWRPTRGVLKLLDALQDNHYTTELGQFQIEANCDAQTLSGDGISRMHAQLDDLVDRARKASTAMDMNVVLMGLELAATRMLRPRRTGCCPRRLTCGQTSTATPPLDDPTRPRSAAGPHPTVEGRTIGAGD